jgi:hypothetical protein
MTFSRLFFCVALFFGAFVVVQPALAQEEPAAEAAPEKPQIIEKEGAEEDTTELRESAEALTKKITENLGDSEKLHFYTLYSNYNIISTVRVVQKDVKNAIESCGEANPDMEDSLDARFKGWSDALNPILEEAKVKIDNMVAAQDYAKSRDIRKLFSNLDDMREEIDSQIDKIPVNTPEACEYLREKMDETQEKLTSMLRTTLVSQPAPPLSDEEPAAGESDEKPAAE